MLKRILWILGILLIVLAIGVGYLALTTKSHSPEDIAQVTLGDFHGEVQYCQPYKKDRRIFGTEAEGALVPYGEVWRTGANEATEIEFSEAVTIHGARIEKGRYSLYTIPDEDSWTVAFNSKLDYWGTGVSNPYEESQDVLRAPAAVSYLDSTAEQFYIRWAPQNDSLVHLQFFWDRTLAELPIMLD